MKFQEVMAYYNYKMSNVARALRVSRESVRLWKEKDEIPFNRQCVLNVISNGELEIDSKYKHIVWSDKIKESNNE